MLIKQVTNQREDIKAILLAEKLPVNDLPATLHNFLVATDDREIIGVAGFEIYGNYGLMRSVAVQPAHRGKGVAGNLIERLEIMAKSAGIKELYLLTETVPEYFSGKGFQKIERDEIPYEVKQSSEFSHVCPVSAIAMKKLI